MFSGTAQVFHQVGQFVVSSVCLLVRVTMVDKNKAVVCCLLATSAIILSEKKKRNRKMWGKKWYLKRNISCDPHLLNELLETDVHWDDTIVVSAGKLWKLWDSLSELHSSVCERRLERTVLRPALLPCQNCAVYSVFPSGMTSRSKIAQFNWECMAPFIYMCTCVSYSRIILLVDTWDGSGLCRYVAVQSYLCFDRHCSVLLCRLCLLSCSFRTIQAGYVAWPYREIDFMVSA